MGMWLRNFAVHGAPPAEVGAKVALWLERKGYERRTVPSLLPVDREDDAIAFLVSNGPWTVVLYNRAFEEGDRLRRELDSFPRLLEVLVADSDDWGYTLFEAHVPTAWFFTQRAYSGEEPGPPGDNGGAEHLCAALGRPEAANAIRAAQRKRALFAEGPQRRFCAALDLAPASVEAGDLIGALHHDLGPKDIAGWRVETFWFCRNGTAHRSGYEPKLHQLAVRKFEPKRPDPVDADLAARAALPPSFHVLRAVSWTIGLLLRPVFWVLRPLLHRGLPRRANGESQANTDDDVSQDFVHAVRQPPKLAFVRDGWIESTLHRCRIRPPVVLTGPGFVFPDPSSVFGLEIDGVHLRCHTLPVEQLAALLTLREHQEFVADEKFRAGPHPARRVTIRQPHHEGHALLHSWYVERPGDKGIIYAFRAYEAQPWPEGTMRKLEDAVRGFEFLSEET